MKKIKLEGGIEKEGEVKRRMQKLLIRRQEKGTQKKGEFGKETTWKEPEQEKEKEKVDISNSKHLS